MKVLITGKNSQLGKSIRQIISSSRQHNNFVFAGREELDFSDNNDIERYFERNNFDVIVNCAAYTDVDYAETEPELAYQINHSAVKKLASIAQKKNIAIIHISTDYVFDGKKVQAYKENDKTNPINIYGKTKLDGEQAIQELMPTNAIIVRTSWVYSEYGNNFVASMLELCKNQRKLKIVEDQIGSPTYAGDLASAILEIVQNKEFKKNTKTTQIYHYSNMGKCNRYEFAEKIFELANVECPISPIKTQQYSTAAKRPLNTLMNKDKIIRELGIEIPHWEDSLNTCIMSLQKEN